MRRIEGKVTGGPVPLAYVEWGPADAPPVVLLHGLRAYGCWFEEFAEVACRRLRLIALDQRGRGNSGWAEAGTYTTDHYVADVERVAQSLGLARFGLVGHSMGGTNAIHYTAAHPSKVAALVVVDMAPEIDPRGIARIKEEVARTPASFPSRDAARAFLRTLHTRCSDRSMETRLDWMLRADADGTLQWRIDRKIFDPANRADPPDRMWTAVRSIACPTLIVRGVLSDIVADDAAARMAAAMPRAERAEIPAAAHMIVEDNPTAFTAAALPFLERNLL